MDPLRDVEVTRRDNQKGSEVRYNPSKHGSLLADQFKRGDRVTLGQGDNQITFTPIDDSGKDRELTGSGNR